MTVEQALSQQGNIQITYQEREALKRSIRSKCKFDIPNSGYENAYSNLAETIKQFIESNYKVENVVIGLKFLATFFHDPSKETKGHRIVNIEALYLYTHNELRLDYLSKHNSPSYFNYVPPKRNPLPSSVLDSTWAFYSHDLYKENSIHKSVLRIELLKDEYNRYKADLILNKDDSEDYTGIAFYDKTCSYIVLNLNKKEGESRDLRLTFFIGAEGRVKLSIASCLYFKGSSIMPIFEMGIIERIEASNINLFLESNLDIPHAYQSFLDLPTTMSHLDKNITDYNSLEKLLNSLNSYTPALKDFEGDYKFFMPGRHNNGYDLIYENTFSISEYGEVKYHNSFTKRTYRGKALMRGLDILQIQIFDSEMESIQLLMNIKVNAYKRSVIFMSATSSTFSGREEPMVFKSVVCPDTNISKKDTAIQQYFYDSGYSRTYAETFDFMEIMGIKHKDQPTRQEPLSNG